MIRKMSELELWIKDNQHVLSLIGVQLCILGYILYGVLGKGNVQIASTITLAFMVSISTYTVARSNKIDKYFENNKTSEISNEINELNKNISKKVSSLKNVFSDEIFENDKINDILKEIHEMNKNISTETSSLKNVFSEEILKLTKINDIYCTYVKITEPRFLKHKDEIVNKALIELVELQANNRTGDLTIRESHDNWSVPILKNLQENDYVKAITFLRYDRGAWGGSSPSSWDDYVEANEIAAKNCQYVKRIFITDEATLEKDLKEQKDNIVKKHTMGDFVQKKMWGIFEDRLF